MRRKRTRKHRDLARRLRAQSTDAEQRAWQLLRNRRLDGYKFRRQHALYGFVVDFYCAELDLVVEAPVTS